MQFNFPEPVIDAHTEEERAEFARLFERGRELHRAVWAYAQTEHLKEAMAVWLARSPGDRLSPTEIARYSTERMYTRAQQEYIDDPSLILRATQGTVVPTIEEIFRQDRAVRSFLNIGVYLGLLDTYFASRFPEISFLGIDFWSDLLEANAPLLRPNFQVRHGYALDEIESGNASGDLVLFFSTATRIKNAELRRYLRALRASKYIVMNEPIFPLPTGEIVNPRDVDPHNSIPAAVYPVYAGDLGGPYPPVLVHNYPALLAEAGFDIVHFQFKHKPSPRMQIVGIGR